MLSVLFQTQKGHERTKPQQEQKPKLTFRPSCCLSAKVSKKCHLYPFLARDSTHKVIHPKYYKHVKESAHHIWADRKWAGFWQVYLVPQVKPKILNRPNLKQYENIDLNS